MFSHMGANYQVYLKKNHPYLLFIYPFHQISRFQSWLEASSYHPISFYNKPSWLIKLNMWNFHFFFFKVDIFVFELFFLIYILILIYLLRSKGFIFIDWCLCNWHYPIVFSCRQTWDIHSFTHSFIHKHEICVHLLGFPNILQWT